MTGEGKQKGSTTDNSRKYTSTTVCRFIKKQDSPTADYFRNLAEKLSFHSNNTGSILIEFAVCMPVLIILLYYISDLSKLKRYYDQTEFMAQQMVNILQNISQNRKDKTVKLTDFKYAYHLASLSMYPGTTVLSKNHCLDQGHFPKFGITYVKGESDGTASWKWMIDYPGGADSPANRAARSSWDKAGASLLERRSNVPPSKIYPSLTMTDGKDRIIVESSLIYQSGIKNIQGYEFKSANEVFNIKMYKLTPQISMPKWNGYWYFFSNAIFTPESGLFDSENKPS